MTRKGRRAWIVGLCLLAAGAAASLVVAALDDGVLFFFSPSDVVAGRPPAERAFRLGGMVAADSVEQESGSLSTHFTVTDHANDITVVYTGILPDLFREGQGVVAEGRLRPDGVFEATEVLAKHDENYMPPEVAEALDAADPEWRTRAENSLETNPDAQ